jgi:hypothetical protein
MNTSVRESINALANRSFATELSLECERLDVLDDLWTVYLADPENEAQLQSDLPALQSMVGEMTQLLSSVTRKSRELSQLIREFPSDLDSELELLLEQHPAKAWLMEDRPTNLAAHVIDACAVVEQESPQAMVELAEKLKRIGGRRVRPRRFSDQPQVRRHHGRTWGDGLGCLRRAWFSHRVARCSRRRVWPGGYRRGRTSSSPGLELQGVAVLSLDVVDRRLQ